MRSEKNESYLSNFSVLKKLFHFSSSEKTHKIIFFKNLNMIFNNIFETFLIPQMSLVH